MIELKNISKFYNTGGNMAVGINDISLKFELGEFVGIYGESGSGKTTLLNIIGGIDSYEEGEMYIDGARTSGYSNEDFEDYRRRNVGFVFQNYQLIDSFTVLQNVLVVLNLQGIKGEEAKQKAINILNRVGLGGRLRNKATKLSGGEKQRCVIARALAGNARLIACDEPTGNLDQKTGESIINLLHELSQDRLVIMVTHNPDAIRPVATRMIRMFDGKVAEDKTLKQPNVITNLKPLEDSKISLLEEAKLAFKVLLATPKKTLFIALTLCFLVLTTMLSFSMLYIQSFSLINMDNYYLTNGLSCYSIADNYLYVSSTSGPIDLTNEEFAKADLIAKENVVSYSINYFTPAKGDNRWFLETYGYITPYFTGTVLIGAKPNKGEVLIGLSQENLYEEYLQSTIGDDFILGGTTLKIAGYYLLPNGFRANEVYMNLEDLYTVQDSLAFKNYDLEIINVTYGGYNLSLRIEEKTTDKYIEVSQHANLADIQVFRGNLQVDYAALGIEIRQVDSLVSVYNISTAAQKAIAENYPSFITLYYENANLREKAYNTLKKNKDLYVIDHTSRRSMFADYNDIADSIGTFFSSLFVGGLILLVTGVVSITLRFVMKSKIKDYDIFRTLGFKKRNIKRINRFEMIFSNVVGVAILCCILLIPQVNEFFDIRLNAFIAGIIISFILVVYIAYRFDKRLFKFTIGHSLKAGDFLD